MIFNQSTAGMALLLQAVFLPAVLFFTGCASEPPTAPPESAQVEQLNSAPSPSTPPSSAPSPSSPRVEADAHPAVAASFTNVAQREGIVFTYYNDAVEGRFFLPEIMGGGAAWLDYDNDHLLDLYLMNGCRLEATPDAQPEHRNGLFRANPAGGFDDVSRAAHGDDNRFGQGCAVGDFDADGFQDLYLTNFGANVLLHNNGDGTFTDVTTAAHVGDALWGMSAVWFDADADADLDLYVVNYLDVSRKNHKQCAYDGQRVYCGPGKFNGRPDRLYLNQANGEFIESAAAWGVASEGKGLVITVVDLDADLENEIYVGNDMAPNFLYQKKLRPDGKAYFENIADVSGCALSGVGDNEASMGISCADFDADGLPDIFLTHYFSRKNTLYRNLGGLVFQDASRRSRIAATSFNSLGFGTVPLDFDRNGSVDLFVATGHVLGPNQDPNEMTPQLLSNNGQGRFTDVSSSSGEYFLGKYLGRGVAGADYDNDGDLDIAVTHLDAPVALLRNDTKTETTFIGFDLQTPSRIPPIGGRVVISHGKQEVVKFVMAGGSYLSSSDSRLLFGLPADVAAVAATVYWPSGRIDHWPQLRTGSYWRMSAGAAPLRLSSP